MDQRPVPAPPRYRTDTLADEGVAVIHGNTRREETARNHADRGLPDTGQRNTGKTLDGSLPGQIPFSFWERMAVILPFRH